MEFLIFSDSHGRSEHLEQALGRQITPPDGILFAGDGLRDTAVLQACTCPLYAVAGNCDWMAWEPTHRFLFCGSHKILLTHGHLFGVKSGVDALMAFAVKNAADIVVFGHTHTPVFREFSAGTEVDGAILIRPLYLFNPGSVGMNGDFGVLSMQGDQVLLSHGRI